MLSKNVLDEISSKVNAILASNPAKDIEKNIHAVLMGVFSKMDLVTREEFAVQQEIVKRMRIRLAELEEKVQKLEQQAYPSTIVENAMEDVADSEPSNGA